MSARRQPRPSDRAGGGPRRALAGAGLLGALAVASPAQDGPFVRESLAPAAPLEPLLARMRHAWTDAEPSPEALRFDPAREAPRRVSAAEAAEDVERLFALFAHGYSGYGLFDEGGRFDAAREEILRALTTRESWPVAELPALFRSHLEFVRDCHTRVGDQAFGGHLDLWCDSRFEFVERDGAWRFDVDGASHALVAIDGNPPAAYLTPSLDADGAPVHRIAVLSRTPPEPLLVEARRAGEAATFEVRPTRSAFESWSRRVFQEDRIGGIGVLRVRGFGDADPAALQRFVESAERYRDEPCVIVDLRGNRGGNERWASDWIERLTGHRPRSSFVSSELESRTTMAGRRNAHLWWDRQAPGVAALRQGLERYEEAAARFAPGGAPPAWTEPSYPAASRIPNPTTVVVVTNALVGSAGEGFVLRMRQAENVVVVGENTRGALTFGNVSLHQLPRSGLKVWLPINFGLFPDGRFREEVGLEPDWWVPSEDAVNRAVAALRRGTVPTARPIPAETLRQRFVPEDPRHLRRRGLIVAAAAAAGALLARRTRARPPVALRLGLLWTVLGSTWWLLGRTRGALLTEGGLAFLSLGVVLLLAAALGRPGGARAAQ